jgi:hypothetical protein
MGKISHLTFVEVVLKNHALPPATQFAGPLPPG